MAFAAMDSFDMSTFDSHEDRYCRARLELEIRRIKNDHGASYQAYLTAKSQQEEMKAHLEKIQQLAGSQSNQLQAYVTELQEALASQSSLLDQMLKSIPPLARKSSAAAELADKVFGIPELLERILLNLPTNTLLKVQQVNRHFFDATQASPRIQMQ